MQLIIGDYPLYVNDIDPYEPLSYQYIPATKSKPARAICNNISCASCIVQADCAKATATAAIIAYIETIYPELVL